ncbi:hypothetical protein HYH03_002092 [Edaphochlamys debaryana]|uniref:Uncharacterized protein n=1 Tax=Edaphochlamys debaryana TaxID=47281 RepID=A0A836C454_9CHLO|nr:hypothetical protein HYH03_002092 [Edaphochlamys debaryana]|eukprot:KAG2499796.1 hypothetical protein HYH03_002092 [Edaphochlamys debaryana]
MASLRSLSAAAGPRLAARRPLLAALPRATTTQRRSPPQRQRSTAPAQAAGGDPTPLPSSGGAGGGGDAEQQPSEPPSERPTGGAAAPGTACSKLVRNPGGSVGGWRRLRPKADRPSPVPAAPSADAAATPAGGSSPAAPAPEPAPAAEYVLPRRCVSLAFHLLAGAFAARIGVDIVVATLVSLVFVMIAAWMVWEELRPNPVRETLIGGLALGVGAALTALTKSGWGALWAAALCLACSVLALLWDWLWPRHRKLLALLALYALPCLVCLGAGALIASHS